MDSWARQLALPTEPAEDIAQRNQIFRCKLLKVTQEEPGHRTVRKPSWKSGGCPEPPGVRRNPLRSIQPRHLRPEGRRGLQAWRPWEGQCVLAELQASHPGSARQLPGCPRRPQMGLERAQRQAPPCRAVQPLPSLQTPAPARPVGLLTRLFWRRPPLPPRYPSPAAHHLLTGRSASVSHGLASSL